MYRGEIQGGFVLGLKPAVSVANANKVRKAFDNLDWIVSVDVHPSEATDNWKCPGVDPRPVKTELFLLPSAHRLEKEGAVTNSGRWLLRHCAAIKPSRQSRTLGAMFVDLMNRVRQAWREQGGAFPDPILKMAWPETCACEKVGGRIVHEIGMPFCFG